MMLAFRELERVEWRVLGALRFLDAANGVPVEAPLEVDPSPEAEIARNRSGLYVIRRYAPLANHNDAFLAPPAAPPIDSVTLRLAVHDPAGMYLARMAEIRLPRDPGPGNAGAANSLFRPVDVELYRSPSAPLGANWVALRVSVTDGDSGDAFGGTLLRVRSNGRILARGLSDWRGEALVPVVGIPVTTWSDDEDAVIVTEINATLEALFDPAAGGLRTPAVSVAAGKPPANLPVPDPAEIEANPAAARAQATIRLAAGRPLVMNLALDLPE